MRAPRSSNPYSTEATKSIPQKEITILNDQLPLFTIRITVSKARQNRNDILRCETKRTIKGVARAQVVLRGLSYRVPEKGLPLEENRPQSSHTGILEYQEVPDDK